MSFHRTRLEQRPDDTAFAALAADTAGSPQPVPAAPWWAAAGPQARVLACCATLAAIEKVLAAMH